MEEAIFKLKFIRRLRAALLKTTHLKRSELSRQYPELFQIESDFVHELIYQEVVNRKNITLSLGSPEIDTESCWNYGKFTKDENFR
jgi:hypothetical protein